MTINKYLNEHNITIGDSWNTEVQDNFDSLLTAAEMLGYKFFPFGYDGGHDHLSHLPMHLTFPFVLNDKSVFNFSFPYNEQRIVYEIEIIVYRIGQFRVKFNESQFNNAINYAKNLL